MKNGIKVIFLCMSFGFIECSIQLSPSWNGLAFMSKDGSFRLVKLQKKLQNIQNSIVNECKAQQPNKTIISKLQNQCEEVQININGISAKELTIHTRIGGIIFRDERVKKALKKYSDNSQQAEKQFVSWCYKGYRWFYENHNQKTIEELVDSLGTINVENLIAHILS